MALSETCTQCSTLGACPFSFTDQSEIVQNYGCLPTPGEIVHMRQVAGKTWACHSNPTKPCLGALNYQKEQGLECHVIDNKLITEQDPWHLLL